MQYDGLLRAFVTVRRISNDPDLGIEVDLQKLGMLV